LARKIGISTSTITESDSRVETRIASIRGDNYIVVWQKSPYAPNNANSIISEYVEPSAQGKGTEVQLIKKAIWLFGKDSLVCQVHEKVWIEHYFWCGFRADGKKTLEETLEVYNEKFEKGRR